jgi:DNA polymerase-3 subunit beta
MAVKAGRSRFSLPTLPRDDFPVIVEGDLPTSFELPAATLAQLIDRTRFAISTEETRYYLNGIFPSDEDLRCRRNGPPLARYDSRPDGTGHAGCYRPANAWQLETARGSARPAS